MGRTLRQQCARFASRIRHGTGTAGENASLVISSPTTQSWPLECDSTSHRLRHVRTVTVFTPGWPRFGRGGPTAVFTPAGIRLAGSLKQGEENTFRPPRAGGRVHLAVRLRRYQSLCWACPGRFVASAATTSMKCKRHVARQVCGQWTRKLCLDRSVLPTAVMALGACPQDHRRGATHNCPHLEPQWLRTHMRICICIFIYTCI